MKLKTIKKCIADKMNEWIETLPKEIQKEVMDAITVTGGCIASMFLQEDVNDYDIYFSSKELLLNVCRHYCDGLPVDVDRHTHEDDAAEDPQRVRLFIKSDGYYQVPTDDKSDESGKYEARFVTENALTLSDKIQIVTRFIGDAAAIHENFDFVHATNYWTKADGLVTNTAALESLLTRELRYTGSRYPLCSILRAKKFIQRKWSINAGQYLKMVLQLNDMDLTDITVLRDQLVGVDSAYFNIFLACVADHKDKGRDLSNYHLMNLIDYVFDGH